MCVAIPYKVLEVKENGRAQVQVADTRQEISVMLVPAVKARDYVLVHLGSAIARIEEEEAAEVMYLYEETAKVAAP